MAAKARGFILLIITAMFVLGFLFGYFIQGSTITATEREIEKVRADVDNFQLEQLLLSQSPERSCPVLINSAGESSIRLYDIVNELRATDPEDPDFEKIKGEADVLSIKSWLLSSSIEDRCGENFTAVLFFYEEDCEKCLEQDAILQELKSDSLLVYSVDFNTEKRIVQTVRSSYNVTSVPAVIVKGNLYGYLSKEELEAVVGK